MLQQLRQRRSLRRSLQGRLPKFGIVVLCAPYAMRLASWLLAELTKLVVELTDLVVALNEFIAVL